MATYNEDVFVSDCYQRNQITGEISRAASITASSSATVTASYVGATSCMGIVFARPPRSGDYAKKRLVSAFIYAYVTSVLYSPSTTYYGRGIAYWKEEWTSGVGRFIAGYTPTATEGLNYISTGAYLKLNSSLLSQDSVGILLNGGTPLGWLSGDGANMSCSLTIQSHLGANKPYLRCVYEDVVPSVTGAYPQSGFVDEKKANVFGWKMTYNSSYVGVPLTQASAKFRWRPADGSYTEILISGPGTNITIPANTFTTDEIEWQVSVTSDDGIESAFTPWYRLTTIDSTPLQPVPVSPVLAFVDGSEPMTFEWEHTIATGSVPSGFDLEYSADHGVTWLELASEVSEATSCIIPPDTLPAGNLQWRARTYNSDGVVGPWSEPAQFVLQAAPQSPAISGVTQSSRPVVSWQSTGQVAYQVRIVSAGYDTGEIAGTAKSHKTRDYLANGDYVIEVRIKNAFSIWSEWANAAFSLAVAGPSMPLLEAVAIAGAASLTFAAPGTARAYLLRNGTPVADVTGLSAYTDYAALGSASYVLRAVDTSDNYTDSAAASVTVTVPHVMLAAVDALSDPVTLMLTRGEPRRLTGSINQVVTYQHYAGRRAPVAVYADQESEVYQIAVAFLEGADRDRLIALLRRQRTMLYRDSWGNRWYVSISTTGYDQDHIATSLSLSMAVVDYVEAVEYGTV